MNSERIIEIWKFVGKVIKLGEIGEVGASGIKHHIVNTVKQLADSSQGEGLYDDLITVVMPLEQRIHPVASALERLPTMCRATVDSYLRTIASELGLSTTSPLGDVLDRLATEMESEYESIAPSGAFYRYFNREYAFTDFPMESPPTIDDELITTVIV